MLISVLQYVEVQVALSDFQDPFSPRLLLSGREQRRGTECKQRRVDLATAKITLRAIAIVIVTNAESNMHHQTAGSYIAAVMTCLLLLNALLLRGGGGHDKKSEHSHNSSVSFVTHACRKALSYGG